MSRLILVTLPIGNLADISKRALNTLNEATVVFCEDTKSFRKLMGLLDLSLDGKQVDSFHDHHNKRRFTELFNYLIKREMLFCL